MSKVVKPDMAIPFLEEKVKTEKDKDKRLGCQIAINILKALPGEEIADLPVCRECRWYDRERKRCRHINGLPGKVYPTFFCPYGDRQDVEAEIEDDHFEFFEGGDDDE